MSFETRIVAEDEGDLRLDRYLRRHHPGLAQGAIQKFCRTGQIRIDGKKAEASARLAAGQEIRVPKLDAAPKPREKTRQVIALGAHETRDLAARILYRDADVMVLDKPSGLATQGGKGIATHLDGMLDALQFEAAERPRLVHRLDRDTSGVLVLARNAHAAAKLAAAFRGRDIQKLYWALVAGRPIPLEGQIDLPLARINTTHGARTGPAARGDEGAAKALTDYATHDYAGNKFSWLDLSPLTGRTHQLRAHCAALGTPILGDHAYADGRATAIGFEDRLHLHARRLTLPHPRGGTLTVEADLPPHMKASFKNLGFSIPGTARPSRQA